MKKNTSGGAICGGVISQSQERADMEKYGVWANAMAWVMPDDKFELYRKAKEAGDDKTATQLFEKYARSMI